MGFSFRDAVGRSPICCTRKGLASQSGQGTVEYVLVLVVSVAIILGTLYQLNTAFKSWANNYFGDYLACLLETGELPTIGGSPGDSGVCEQFFKTFSLAEGRPSNGRKAAENKADNGRAGGERERRTGPSGGNYTPVRYGSSGRFGGKWRSGAGGPKGQKVAGVGSAKAGGVNDYGGGGGYYQRPQPRRAKTKLDNKFAFEDGRDDDQRRKPIVATKKEPKEDDGRKPVIKLKPNSLKRNTATEADTAFSVGNFIRIIIIAAIIIALVMFIGGQVLSITKSME